MTVLLPASAVAFAALCIWLAARIINRRERWAKWTAAGLAFVMLVVYPVSIGPPMWIASRMRDQESAMNAVETFYIPVIAIGATFRPAGEVIEWWVNLGCADFEPNAPNTL